MRIPGNFDRWMFNYKEGNLSAEEAAYFESFMLSNPNFAEDAEAWDQAFVRKETIEYPNMDALLKEKSPFTSWRNIAAILLLLCTVGGGIGIANSLLNNNSKLYKARVTGTSSQSESAYQSPERPPLNNGKTGTLNGNVSIAGLRASASINSFNTQNMTGGQFGQSANTNSLALNGNAQGNGSDVNNADSFYQNFYNGSSSSARNSRHSKSQNKNRKIDSDKIKGSNSDYAGSYSMNPTFDVKPIDSDFKKRKTSVLAYKIKRFLNKIDKISGYSVALVNLRDPDLLIPNKNMLNFNPGFAGGGGNFRMGGDYRNQWSETSLNSQLSTLYFDTYSAGAKGGIGGSVTYGQYKDGVYQNMSANLYYSPKFALGAHVVFEPAIKVTMGRDARNINTAQSQTAIEFDRGRVFNQGEITQAVRNDSWYKDYGVGFVINTDWFYVGGFVDNLSGHDERIYGSTFDVAEQSPRIITGVIGFDYQSRNKRTTLSPFLTYYQNGTKKEAWAGATAQFNWLTLGASYSSNNEYAASVGLKFKAFRLTYQMDMTESQFLQENFVSHNIGIRFSTPNKTIR